MKNFFSSAFASAFVTRSSRFVLASLLLLSFFSLALVDRVAALYYEPITTSLDEGEQNQDVTRLQTFVRDNPAIYPEGLVTGYYGSLTKKAVIRFQNQYGLDQVGRVGPLTREKINSLISAGGWNGGGVTTGDVSGPSFSNMTYGVSSNSLTFTFNTNELTNARVVYYTSPLMFNEGDINSNGFGPIGGYGATSINNGSNGNYGAYSHSITVPNLSSGTVYYYTVIASDSMGNVSVWGPNNALRTSN